MTDVDEAFTLAKELREGLENGDIGCEPIVHIAGCTDCKPAQGHDWLEAPSENARVRAVEHEERQRVISKARSLAAMRAEVENLEQKLSEEHLHGRRREYVESELEDARESLARIRENLVRLNPDEICDALLASKSAHDGPF